MAESLDEAKAAHFGSKFDPEVHSDIYCIRQKLLSALCTTRRKSRAHEMWQDIFQRGEHGVAWVRAVGDAHAPPDECRRAGHIAGFSWRHHLDAFALSAVGVRPILVWIAGRGQMSEEFHRETRLAQPAFGFDQCDAKTAMVPFAIVTKRLCRCCDIIECAFQAAQFGFPVFAAENEFVTHCGAGFVVELRLDWTLKLETYNGWPQINARGFSQSFWEFAFNFKLWFAVILGFWSCFWFPVASRPILTSRVSRLST
ncbi:hypothetical protein [Marivita sp.]|uniref:hypothetical protein n=1 Tax=Marivita sp. TaxID=2003365 RepID=UPI0026171F11|nr:hypothetical protein [Marivita sp.]